MADSQFRGLDLNTLLAVAGSQPVGQQKAKLCADIVAAVGANPIYEIRAGSTVLYRATVAGLLSSSAEGISLPTQFSEPPSVNVADDLSGSNVVEIIRSASSPSLEIETPLKSGGGTGFLTASKGLDGSYTVRTSGRIIRPPSSLDSAAGGGDVGPYSMRTLVDDMTTANDNGWHIEAAPNTANHLGPGGSRYAQINYALKRSNGRSHWPGEYLDDAAPNDRPINDSTSIYLLPWYVVGRAAQVTDARPNLRVQVRNLTLRGLKADTTWETIVEVENPMEESSWHANFLAPTLEITEPVEVGPGFAQIRAHSAAEGGGASLGSIGYGNDGSTVPRYYKWTNHGYAGGTSKTRSQWVSGYRGLTFSIEARCILHDPTGPDHRNNSGLLMWPGADWYVEEPGSFANYIGGVGSGRLRLITADWQIYSMSEQSMNDLATYPIDGFTPA